MPVQRINAEELWTPPGDVLAQTVVATGSRMVFVSGQVAVDGSGTLVGGVDLLAQAHQAFVNLRAALESGGAKPEDVVKMTLYLVDHTPDMVFSLFDVGRKVFEDHWPVAASVMVGVQRLALPDWLIEIDAIAVTP